MVCYTNLEASRIRSWKDLITAFIRQYQYNIDMALDRTQLQNMCKREHKSIKEYAQRWRDLAAQMVPPMMEREMITMIVDTLSMFYYEKLVEYKQIKRKSDEEIRCQVKGITSIIICLVKSMY